MNDEIVQYFVVNSELNMSAGKIAAQVGHVATDVAVDLSITDEDNFLRDHCGFTEEDFNKIDMFREWHNNN